MSEKEQKIEECVALIQKAPSIEFALRHALNRGMDWAASQAFDVVLEECIERIESIERRSNFHARWNEALNSAGNSVASMRRIKDEILKQ